MRLAYEREAKKAKEQEEADASIGLEKIKFVRGLAGTGQPFIDYPQLSFEPRHLFAAGSPIGLFLTVR